MDDSSLLQQQQPKTKTGGGVSVMLVGVLALMALGVGVGIGYAVRGPGKAAQAVDTGGCVKANTSTTLKIGTFEDTFHQCESNTVAKFLESRGYKTEIVGGDLTHDVIFAKFWNREFDLFPSVWLPDGHKAYVANKTEGTDYVVLGTTSDQAVFSWAVSPALAAQGVESIEDLANETKIVGVIPVIHGPPAATGIAVASEAIIARLNSEQTAVNFSYNANFSEFFDYIEANYNTDKKFVIGWWKPFWGNEVYKGLTLLEPGWAQDLFGRPNRGTTLAHPDFVDSGRLDPTTMSVLNRLYIATDALVAMDYQYGYLKKPREDAVDQMMADTKYSYWYDLYKSTSTLTVGPPLCKS